MSERRERGERQSLLLPILIPVVALVVIVAVLFLFSRVLLSLKPNAATATALVAAVGVIAFAAFVGSRRQVTGPALTGFVVAVAGIGMLAGGIAIAVIGPPEEEAEAFHATVTAPRGAAADGFATDVLSVEEQTPIDLEFDNQDDGVGHNVQIFNGTDASGAPLFTGAIVTGPTKTVYHVPPLAGGEYFFHCEVHPTTMTGTITAEQGAGGIRIQAKNTAFDTQEIDLAPDAPTSLTFDNQDPLPHNVSIYDGQDASGEQLFTFTPFTGPAQQTFDVPAIPAGQYYFQCDVHPVMSGTVVVAPPEGGGGGDGGGADGGGGAGDGGGGDAADGGG
jgi:plastocyanin